MQWMMQCWISTHHILNITSHSASFYCCRMPLHVLLFTDQSELHWLTHFHSNDDEDDESNESSINQSHQSISRFYRRTLGMKATYCTVRAVVHQDYNTGLSRVSRVSPRLTTESPRLTAEKSKFQSCNRYLQSLDNKKTIFFRTFQVEFY